MRKLDLNIKGSHLGLMDSKSKILNMIDKEINDCKLSFIQSWISNHETSTDEREEIIKELEEKKREVIYFFDQLKINATDVKINISISAEAYALKKEVEDVSEIAC